MSHLVPVREYTDASLLLADIAARRRRMFAAASAKVIDDPEDTRIVRDPTQADIRSMPRRMWDDQEVGTLRRLMKAGVHKKEIAAKLQRSVASVEFKGWSLGLEFARLAKPSPTKANGPPKRDWLNISIPQQPPRKAPWRLVATVVSRATDVSLEEMTCSRRIADIVRARQLACLLIHRHTLLSLSEIGARLGNRDHTTVLYSIRKLEALSKTDIALANMIASLTAEINAAAPPASLEAA